MGAHLEAARASEESTLSMEETQAIADRVWALLDAVREDPGGGADRALCDRTEDAAEAVMRDRDGEGRTRALAALAGALGALRNELEPAPPPSCELEERESAELRRIQAALERIDDGSYGLCQICGRSIPASTRRSSWSRACSAATSCNPSSGTATASRTS